MSLRLAKDLGLLSLELLQFLLGLLKLRLLFGKSA
jgi:hypothetical protein